MPKKFRQNRTAHPSPTTTHKNSARRKQVAPLHSPPDRSRKPVVLFAMFSEEPIAGEPNLKIVFRSDRYRLLPTDPAQEPGHPTPKAPPRGRSPSAPERTPRFTARARPAACRKKQCASRTTPARAGEGSMSHPGQHVNPIPPESRDGTPKPAAQDPQSPSGGTRGSRKDEAGERPPPKESQPPPHIWEPTLRAASAARTELRASSKCLPRDPPSHAINEALGSQSSSCRFGGNHVSFTLR
jgi:hypothetical protein